MGTRYLQERLTEKEKAMRVQCPFCGRWYLRLGRHVGTAHGMSRVRFEELYPDIPWYAPIEWAARKKSLDDARRDFRTELAALRAATAGRPKTKADIFAEALKLHDSGMPWSKIVKQLSPAEYKSNVEAAVHRFKEGVRYLRKKQSKGDRHG